MIAHDIHDAVKLSRKRTRKQRKEAKKQMKKDIKSYKKTGLKSPPTSATQGPSSLEPPQHQSSKRDKPTQVGSSTVKAEEKKPTDLSITIQTTPPNPHQISPPPPENPFEDPITTDTQRPKHNREKRRKKEKAKRASPGTPDQNADPFRDPEPMRVIDADDFRLELPERSYQPDNSSEEALLPNNHRVGSGKLSSRSKKNKEKEKDKGERKQRKKKRDKDKASDDHVRDPTTEVKPMQTAMRLSGGGYRISLRVS